MSSGAPPAAQSAARLAALRRAMAGAGVDLAVVGPTAELRHLLGYRAHAVDRLTVLLVSQAGAVMVMPDFDVPELVELTGHEQVLGWSDVDGPDGALDAAFPALALGADPLAALDDELTYVVAARLRERLGTRPPRLLSELTTPLRIAKPPEAWDALARAGEVVARGVDAAFAAARPGMTELELQAAVEAGLWEAGADAVAGGILVQGGPGSASPHHLAGRRPLRAGEPVLIDVFVPTGGWCSDTTQQLWLGDEPDSDYTRAYEMVREAQAAGVAAAVVGARVGDVALAAEAVLDAAGYREVRSARVGHGIGLEVHEPPSVWSGNDLALREGMLITVEPGVYLPGRWGVRIEDTVLVTAAGPRPLTRGSRPLFVKPV